mmetsp:Transcript_52225/g.113913  ORF Transcript_52225/g.113913 Transcript_52225/m.113913 type:complete len:215 (-) Transcript_52225:87-731(-)
MLIHVNASLLLDVLHGPHHSGREQCFSKGLEDFFGLAQEHGPSPEVRRHLSVGDSGVCLPIALSLGVVFPILHISCQTEEGSWHHSELFLYLVAYKANARTLSMGLHHLQEMWKALTVDTKTEAAQWGLPKDGKQLGDCLTLLEGTPIQAPQMLQVLLKFGAARHGPELLQQRPYFFQAQGWNRPRRGRAVLTVLAVLKRRQRHLTAGREVAML